MAAEPSSTESLALSADEVKARYGIDLTTAEVLRHALSFISLQMQLKLNTAALSPLLSEVNDFGIGLLAPRDEGRDLDFDSAAMATAAPGHYIINQFYARMAIEHFGAENFAPGDVIIYNDAYRGGSHVQDVGTLMPIFDGDELMGFAAAITHWVDIGGPVPTGLGAGRQYDMYSEGIRLTPRHLYRGGELVRETVELFTEQTRVPEISLNDLQVVGAALKVGADMVSHYVKRYGRDTYKSAIQYTLDHSERTVRHALRQVPDGTYEAEDFLDNNMDGDPVLCRCTVRKHGDNVEVDFSGSSREDWGGYACQWSDAATGTHLGLQVILPEEIAPNAGAYRPIHIVIPPGGCFHALPPMSTNAGHTMFTTKAVGLVKMALSQADPELAVGENYDDVAWFGVVGVDDRSETPSPFIAIRVFSGPYGGSAVGDGCAFTLAEGGNCVEPSLELDEEAFPVLVLAKEFVPDTAGMGEHRGGPATRYLIAPLVDAESGFQLDQCRFETKGVLGGLPGSRAQIAIHRGALDAWARGELLENPEIVAGIADAATGLAAASEEEPGAEFRVSKGMGTMVSKGDVIIAQVAGGGGYGDPARREPEAVERDLRDGIVTSAPAA